MGGSTTNYMRLSHEIMDPIMNQSGFHGECQGFVYVAHRVRKMFRLTSGLSTASTFSAGMPKPSCPVAVVPTLEVRDAFENSKPECSNVTGIFMAT